MVRIKHRYLLLNILYPDQFASTKPSSNVPLHVSFHAPSPTHLNAPLLLAHLRGSISTHFGDCGLGLTSATLRVVYFSPTTSTAIIRCPRAHFRLVWAALTFMDQMPGVQKGDQGRSCVVQVVRVSGTIKKSEEELIRRARMEVVRARDAEAGRLDELIGGDDRRQDDWSLMHKAKEETSLPTDVYSDEDLENIRDENDPDDVSD